MLNLCLYQSVVFFNKSFLSTIPVYQFCKTWIKLLLEYHCELKYEECVLNSQMLNGTVAFIQFAELKSLGIGTVLTKVTGSDSKLNRENMWSEISSVSCDKQHDALVSDLLRDKHSAFSAFCVICPATDKEAQKVTPLEIDSSLVYKNTLWYSFLDFLLETWEMWGLQE